MKNTTKALTVMLALLSGISVQAGPTNYFDLNGTTTGSGVTNGATYTWNTNDAVWNSSSTGGSGTFANWQDIADNSSTWYAKFSAGAKGSNYTVVVPAGEERTFKFACANKDTVAITAAGSGSGRGSLNPYAVGGTTSCGLIALQPATLTISNIIMDVSHTTFIRIQGASSLASSAGLVKLGPDVDVGFKQWSVENSGTFDLGNYLDKDLVFTTNWPYGGRIAHIFFNSAGNNVLQGSGVLTVPVTNWVTAESDPAGGVSWSDPNGNFRAAGGFAGRGGKLTVNLFGDGRTLQWTNGPNGYFIGYQGTLILGSLYGDSEVEFQNGIDLCGDAGTDPLHPHDLIRVLKSQFPPSSGDFATISGAITDSVGGAGIIKASQSANANGTLVLSGANTYRGATVIAQGKLIVTSSHQGGGDVIVTNNSTLGVRVTSTATVPMASLTLGSATGSNGALEINYCAASTNAPITATNFTVSGTTATINVGGRLKVGQFPLVQYTGSIAGNGFAGLALGTLPAGVSATLVDNSGNSSVDLNITAAPAITTLAIANLAASETTLSFTATNGLPDCGCSVLSSSDVSTPVASWTTVSTHTFGTNGTFQFSTSNNGGAQQFYILRQP